MDTQQDESSRTVSHVEKTTDNVPHAQRSQLTYRRNLLAGNVTPDEEEEQKVKPATKKLSSKIGGATKLKTTSDTDDEEDEEEEQVQPPAKNLSSKVGGATKRKPISDTDNDDEEQPIKALPKKLTSKIGGTSKSKPTTSDTEDEEDIETTKRPPKKLISKIGGKHSSPEDDNKAIKEAKGNGKEKVRELSTQEKALQRREQSERELAVKRAKPVKKPRKF